MAVVHPSPQRLVRLACVAATLSAALFIPSEAGAVSTPITDCDDETALRAAVDSGGDYAFDCVAGNHNIDLSSPLTVTSSVTLDANGETVRIVNNDGHAFEVVSGELVLVDLTVHGYRAPESAGNGAAGVSGTDGAQGADIACTAGNVGAKADDGEDGTPAVSGGGGGADGGDKLGGGIYIETGATVSVYGGHLSGIISGESGGSGGNGGSGGSGGNGGSPVGTINCSQEIYGGDGGLAADGADGGDGGDGGDAKGGAVYVESGATLNVSGTLFQGTAAYGGYGGHGGAGGQGGWAGRGGSAGGPCCSWYGRPGGYSGTGGNAGAGGDAGNAHGGAIYSEGTVNLTDAIFKGPEVAGRSGGNGAAGGEGGNGHGNVEPPVGDGGDGGDAGDGGDSAGGAIYSTGTLNVYSAVFENTRAGYGPTYGWGTGGEAGAGGASPYPQNSTIGVAAPTSGDGGDGGDGGDATGASIFGSVAFKGCANFTGSALGAGDGGLLGAAGATAWEGISGVAGKAGLAGFAGAADPSGFAPYPCASGPGIEGPPGDKTCSDGLDNDKDGLIDENDPGCNSEDGHASDSTPPKARLYGRSTQRAGKTVAVGVSCPEEACTATAGGSIVLPQFASASKRVKLKPVKRAIPKGGKVAIKLKLPVGRVLTALRAGKAVAVKIVVVVSDLAGNKRSLRRKVKLIRR